MIIILYAHLYIISLLLLFCHIHYLYTKQHTVPLFLYYTIILYTIITIVRFILLLLMCVVTDRFFTGGPRRQSAPTGVRPTTANNIVYYSHTPIIICYYIYIYIYIYSFYSENRLGVILLYSVTQYTYPLVRACTPSLYIFFIVISIKSTRK